MNTIDYQDIKVISGRSAVAGDVTSDRYVNNVRLHPEGSVWKFLDEVVYEKIQVRH